MIHKGEGLPLRLEACYELSRKCSVLPTMMFSTSDDERDVQLAYDLGANAYFVKPALVSELKAILQTAYEFWARCVKPKARSGK